MRWRGLVRRGQGVAKNLKTAADWYTKAAEQGHAKAQFNLGVMYRNGEGVPRDYVQAYFWWSLSGAQGEQDATRKIEATEKLMSRSAQNSSALSARSVCSCFRLRQRSANI